MGSKIYEVTFNDGTKERTHNMNQFCKKYGLNQGQMSRVANGVISNHLGHTVRLLDSNGDTASQARQNEKEKKILDMCRKFVETPFVNQTSKQIENLIITLYALEKMYGDKK